MPNSVLMLVVMMIIMVLVKTTTMMVSLIGIDVDILSPEGGKAGDNDDAFD